MLEKGLDKRTGCAKTWEVGESMWMKDGGTTLETEVQVPTNVGQSSANFYKRAGSKYFRLCRT